MILDEPMEMAVSKKVRFSSGGGFAEADKLIFDPPKPSMARDLFKINRYFNKMQQEVAGVVSKMAGTDVSALKEEVEVLKLQAGGDVKSLHIEYADDDPAAKEAKLKEIEELITGFSQMFEMCAEVDFYKMTCDFGAMVVNNALCKLSGKPKDPADGEGEVTAPMTMSLWNDSIDYKDRLAAVLRYSCFFGLTSSLPG